MILSMLTKIATSTKNTPEQTG